MQVRAWYNGHAWDQKPETPTELTGALQGLKNAVEVGSDDEAFLIHSLHTRVARHPQRMSSSCCKKVIDNRVYLCERHCVCIIGLVAYSGLRIPSRVATSG